MHSRIFCRVASNHVQNRACTLGNRAVYASRPHAFARGAFRYTQIRFLLDHYAPEYARARFAAIEQDHHLELCAVTGKAQHQAVCIAAVAVCA